MIVVPNPNLLTTTAGCKHKNQIGDKNPRLGRTTTDWAHKNQIRKKKLPMPKKLQDQEQFRQWRAQFHNRGLQKPNAVEEHGSGRKSLAAGPKK